LQRTISPRSLIVVAVLAIAAFIGAEAVGHALASRIDVASDSLARNSSPSIAKLAALHGEVRQLQYRLDAYVDERAAGNTASLAAVDASVDTIGEDTRAYLELSPFPGERPYWDDLQQAVVSLNRTVSRVLTLVDEGEANKAQLVVARDLTEAADRTTTKALAAIAFNAKNERALAIDIQKARHQANIVSWSLTGLAVVLTGALGLLARRLVRQQAEVHAAEARLTSRRIEELEVFAGRVAHDIMNPVAAASMAIDLARRTSSEERTRAYAERATKSLARSRMLVDDLLEFTRAAATPEPGACAELRQVVDDTIADVVAAMQPAGVTFDVQVPRCACACTPGVLASLVANLVRNAVKYAGGGLEPRVVVRAVESRGVVRFEVEDNGPGLAAGLGAENVFSPLVRGRGTGQPGIGLGLATVKRLAEAHGGRVGCASRRDKGCTFWFELPPFALGDSDPPCAGKQELGPDEAAAGHANRRA
jgi:signal transduction histidine kinase